VTDDAITTLTAQIGVRAACEAVGATQAGYYRRHRVSPTPERPSPTPHRERVQPRALSAVERQTILDALHSERFMDLAPAEMWAILLDEGTYLLRPEEVVAESFVALRFRSARHRSCAVE